MDFELPTFTDFSSAELDVMIGQPEDAGDVEVLKPSSVVVVTRRQALDHALFKEGLSGNVSAVRELDRRGRDRALAAKAGDEERLTSEDQQAFDRCLERLRRETASAGEGVSTSAAPALRRPGGGRR